MWVDKNIRKALQDKTKTPLAQQCFPHSAHQLPLGSSQAEERDLQPNFCPAIVHGVAVLMDDAQLHPMMKDQKTNQRYVELSSR